MSSEPHKILLDRDLYAAFIREEFSDTTDLIEELVNYGSNLVPRCYVSSEQKLHDIVVIWNFLKQGVALLDGIHVLALKGSTTPCFLCGEFDVVRVAQKRAEYNLTALLNSRRIVLIRSPNFRHPRHR